MIRQLEGLAHEKPVVTVWEDALWLDPTSRELLDLNVEHVRSLPVLLIVTFRPEFQPPWAGQPQVSMLALNMEFIQVPCGQSRYLLSTRSVAQSVHSITGRSRAEALQSRLMDVVDAANLFKFAPDSLLEGSGFELSVPPFSSCCADRPF